VCSIIGCDEEEEEGKMSVEGAVYSKTLLGELMMGNSGPRYPRVAVITSTKNRGRYLEFQVAQLKAQAYPQDSIIWVVVDGSDDDADSWEGVVAMYPRVVYERIPSSAILGFSRNRSLEIARSLPVEYVAFWDDDDVFVRTRLSGPIMLLEKNRDYDAAGSSACDVLLLNGMIGFETQTLRETRLDAGRPVIYHAVESYLTVRKSYIMGHNFDGAERCRVMPPFLERFNTPILWYPHYKQALMIGHDTNTYDKYVYYDKMKDSGALMSYRMTYETLAKKWLPDVELYQLFLDSYF
jgi:glycosyltransferase involved in cell wall biosynthesis